ncbi:MAG: hypothetical protein QOD74_3118 [Variibacter sp.]|jgi:cytochrome c2|nr:hypothetical protein [Variibacter sp.]
MPSRSVSIAALVVLAAGVSAAAAGGGYYQYRERQESKTRAIALTGGNPDRARDVIGKYGCAGCHQISGIRSPGGRAAPPLNDVGARMYVGGVLTNTGDNLVRWIVNPKAFSPRTAMPVTGISEEEARHVATYLYALR